jgi:GT2 family glycosyltransferase
MTATRSPGSTLTLPVSVVIPAYNRAGMLERALTSVFSQRPAVPAEVIVVDDGSADRTAAVAEQLGARVIRHTHNRGLCAARNTGVRAAAHDWVALLDSDDEWLPHHLSHLWSLRDPHVLVASSSMRCGSDPERDRFHGPAGRSRPVVLSNGERLIFPGNHVPVSAAMVRRESVLGAGGFRAFRGVVEDFDMWLRLLELGTAISSPLVTVIYHVHDQQMSAQDARTMQLAHIDAAEAYLARTGRPARSVRRWEGTAAWENLRTALEQRRPREALAWTARLAAHPQRPVGVLGTWIERLLVRRRSAALRAAGVGPLEPRPRPARRPGRNGG